jgi:hypothetical protein
MPLELEHEFQCALHRRAPDGFTIATEKLPLGEQLNLRSCCRGWSRASGWSHASGNSPSGTGSSTISGTHTSATLASDRDTRA